MKTAVVFVLVAASSSSIAAPPPRTMLVPVPAGPSVPLPLAGPQLLYLNDCKPSGCVVKPGTDDSRVNQSSIVRQTHLIEPYAGDPIIWDAVVACVRENYAPFGIDVVTTDPGNVPHFEAVVAGLPTQIAYPDGVAGVSPYTCEVIPNAITYTFANVAPNDALALCWTASQESAHAFGLEHAMLAGDAMTYVVNPPRKRFLDEMGCIGSQGCCQPALECRCNRTQINSYRRLLAVLGPRPTPPTVTIATPADGDVVAQGFQIEVATEDTDGIAKVEIVIDGALAATLTSPPFALATDPALAPGTHTIVARAEDTLGAIAETPAIEVTRALETRDAEVEPPMMEGDAGCCQSSRDGATSSIAALLLALVFRRRTTRSRYRA